MKGRNMKNKANQLQNLNDYVCRVKECIAPPKLQINQFVGMSHDGLEDAQIVLVVVLSVMILVLLSFIIYKVVTGQKRRQVLQTLESANQVRVHTFQPTIKKQMADLQTKASKSDKNVEEQDDHPSINAEEIIQSVFAPDTEEHVYRRRKVNKVIKKQREQELKLNSN